ncbi:MBOAT family O-acyltransferase [Loktanella sp. DJP18]|uniref:MBOAT family O-acyltransferase n=1 Tax=Loktanella sp. DJP18 TaxID=3409788 RepID=UPI003BB77623
MLFSQLEFWYFFAAVFALYLVLPFRAQNAMLLVASYIFYGSWDWRFLGLIAISTIIDYLLALRIDREIDPALRRRYLIVSMFMNLGLLGVFKYLNFFIGSFAALSESMGIPASLPVLGIVLPVGISFYTFQTMSYTIDVYRRELKPAANFWDFALFVAFFPQLVAGPIERARNLLPEIMQPRTVTWDNLSRGAVLCLIGLIKKIVIADAIAPMVDAVYGLDDPSGGAVLVATWLFAIQIYCDFSGYTDIARGVAKMLGFGLMRNFAQPYFATNPQEFWRRWHISLSTWLRDYLYIWLGGNRHGTTRTKVNLMTTMVLGGLWHGAAWNFVLWGIYQGGLLVTHRQFFGRAKADVTRGIRGAVKRVILIALFFQVVSYGWLLFRANSFAQIVDFTARLTTIRLSDFADLPMPDLPFPALVGLLLLLTWDSMTEITGRVRFYADWPAPARGLLWAVLIYALAFGATTASGAFIYFQF